MSQPHASPNAADDLGPLEAPFAEFVAVVRQRLAQGQREYAGTSLERAPAELLAEIAEELADVAGWAVLLWRRLERLRRAAAALPNEPPPSGPHEHAGGAIHDSPHVANRDEIARHAPATAASHATLTPKEPR